ncbi:Queuine tRNA-ribosyltransferase accessory subunit 2 [Merluccius polli]|uniref:Queuine tRNA-ribosyltransferase accessory subunit 2 n=1 Tax=Merluccius polli TaxID=89951 RepID=A0AA47M6V7_MERPO|nr:Queuine tRNA-ribosyltransferase accessory subunit 2 [Merluccius polli]
MKLELTRVVQGGYRVGVLREVGRAAHTSMEVPGCLLYTRCGAVPHLTHDTLRTVSPLPPVTQLTLSTVAEHREVLEEYKDGFKKFAGLHDTALYCSLHDPVTPYPAGHITNKTVSVWGSGGRIELTVARFMALQKALRPDLYQSMADGETWQGDATSRKRIRKSVDRTLAHLDECLLIHHQTPELQGAEVLGVVEGGDSLEERVRSAKETAKRPVGGFCLDGFQTGCMERSLRTRLIAAVARELPEDKPRLLQGVGRPDEVVACVEAGVTERGCALTFDLDLSPDTERAGSAPPAVLELGEEKEETWESEQSGDVLLEDQAQTMTPFEMDLKDTKYRDDLTPLVDGCGCYCCTNHQRAYLHHLLVTNELLAGVLLMIHNTAQYNSFFRALREALANDKLEFFKKRVLSRKRVGHKEAKE